MEKRFVIVSVIVLIACVTISSGCSHRLSADDYTNYLCDGIHNKADIQERFGKPSLASGPANYEVWRYNIGPDFITIQFRDKRAIDVRQHQDESDIRGMGRKMRIPIDYDPRPNTD